MAELADALDLGSNGAIRGGSSPPVPTVCSSTKGNGSVQVTITAISPTQQEAAFDVSDDDLQPHFDRAYEEFRPKAQLRGFRKGKVPLSMIKKIYGEAIEQDAIDRIANDLYRAAMDERNIQPLGTPSMTALDFQRKQYLRFTVKYDVRPPITLDQYKGITVDKPVHPVTDAEVEDELHHLRRANSTTAEAETVTDSEHTVTADVQELDDTGAPLIGKKTSGTRFYLADPALAPEIRDALQAARTGETYTVRHESTHEGHTHKHHYAITVTGIEKVILPPFDEALVTKITGGKVTSPEEFRTSVRNDLRGYWENQAMTRLNDAIANEVVRRHDVPVPDSLVEAYLDSFLEDMKSRTRDRKLPAGFDVEKFRTESRPYAIWQAKWSLLKEAIAEKEGLNVTDEEISSLAEAEAKRIGIGKDRLLEYYTKSSGATERLLSEKVMNFLRSHATVKETMVESTRT
jgi:trigger factor